MFVIILVTFILLARDEQKKVAEENKRMGVEQKNHKEYLDKIVYSNKPTAAYYEQFNKSTR